MTKAFCVLCIVKSKVCNSIIHQLNQSCNLDTIGMLNKTVSLIEPNNVSLINSRSTATKRGQNLL
ncbi:hypothetical protein CXF58_13315 [Psychrobacter sp. Sarcosine-02u-2]|nr:hypothetical protein CXF58_13315 [Psychrobacter sp. Sarcosine-02u-2]